MSKTPAQPQLSLDPVFEFGHHSVAALPRRKQRLFALYYLRALQTGTVGELRQSVPAHLYRPLRHFLAESDWDHRSVIRRAAARVVPRLEIEWVASHVSAVADKWAFAWVGAYSADEVVPLDLMIVGPARFRRRAEEFIPAQRDLIGDLPAALVQGTPLGLGGALAEDASFRRELAGAGVLYTAKVRPEHAGFPIHGGRPIKLRAYVEQMRSRAARRSGPITWAAGQALVETPAGRRPETVVAYWREDGLVSVVFTNLTDARAMSKLFDPGGFSFPARSRRRVAWRRTSLRGRRAWEHHLALVAVLHNHGVNRRQGNER